jgi:GNAT superfamily N-acetyltransferase
MDPLDAVDRNWAELLQCSPETLRIPGLHLIEGHHLDRPHYMGYVLPFFAVMPLHTPDNLTVMGSAEVCAEIAHWSIEIDRSKLELQLLAFAETLGNEASYICDVLTASSDQMLLSDTTEVEDGTDAVDWDGKKLSAHVDGATFVTRDERGITAWAGEKCMTPHARDIQIATREDMRRQGLAKKVASRTFQHIMSKGLTPYYAHFRGNVASAELAKSLGFRPYGSAVFSEYDLQNV